MNALFREYLKQKKAPTARGCGGREGECGGAGAGRAG